MKYVILIALLSIFTIYSSNAQAPDCWDRPDGTLIGDSKDQRIYYRCESGIPIPLQCEAGTVFCALVNGCISICPGTQTTTTTTTPRPTTTTTTTTTPRPTTTTTSTPQPTTTTTTTPRPTITTTTTPTPTPPTTTTPLLTTWTPVPTASTPSTTATTTGPTPDPNMCKDYQNGVIFPLTGSCSGFVMCIDGLPKVGYCQGNTQFNPNTGTCGTDKCN